MLYDVFISSARPDEDFALGVLADGLARTGLRVHHRGKFVPGRPVLDELEHAVQHSEHVVAVLSPSYLSDEFAAFERVLGQHLAVEDRRKLLIPVIYRHAELPPLLRVLIHVDCTDPAGWNQAIEQLCRTLGRPAPSAPDPPACPYPGLSPFTEKDHSLFFGRDDEIDVIVGRLARRSRALLVGPSGSGKSSLVFAGVVPRLGRSALLPGEWSVQVTRPGRPEAPVFGDEPRRLLIIDQLEELFTLPGSDRDAVRTLVERDDCAVIATMRADFYGDLMASDLWDVLRDHRVEVPPLHRDALEEAIRRPALEVGVYVEAELARKLVDDAGGEPGMMPLVQETMRDLWDRLEWRFLPLSAYVLPRRSYGRSPRTGLHRALEAHAEAAYTQLSSAQQATAFRLFVRLVQPIAGRASVRRRRTTAQLEEIADDPLLLRATIDALVDARLLTLSGDGHVDLAHEALITGWSRLGEWIEQAGQAEVVRERLEAKAARWHELGYQGGLLDAIELAEAQQWLASLEGQRLGTDKSIRDLVTASVDALEVSTHRRLAIRNRWIGAVSLVAVVALVAAIIAVWKGGEASRNARDAKATELAAIADGLASQSLDLALLLSVEAYHLKPAQESVATLVNTLGRVPSLERVLHGHTEEVRAVTVSPDGKTVASAGRDDQIVLWDADGNEIRRLSGHTNEVHSLAFTPDGATLVSTSSDRTIRRWVVATGAQAGPTLNGHTAEIRGAAVDPKGRWIASASHDQTARLWHLATGAELATFRDHTGSVLDVAFSPDGDLLASAGEDGRVIVRSLSGQRKVEHDFSVPARAVAFHPANAALLAIALNDGTTVLWDLATDPVVLTRSSERVFDVAFAPDGTRLAAASRDQVVTVVDLADRQVRRLDGHGGDVRSVAFFPDGARLASGSRDTTVMLWNLDRPQRLANATISSGAPIAVQYQARGAEVLSVNQNGTAETFAVTTGDKIRSVPLVGASDVVVAAVSPDGALVAVGSGTGVVGIWRADNGSPLWTPIAGHDADIRALRFSPDGALLISGGGDAQTKVWEVATGVARHVVRFDFPVADVAFGPGGLALTTDQNGTMWGWAQDAAAPRRHEVSDNRIRSVHIGLSPDGVTVAAGTSQDRIEVRRIGADLRASTVTEIDHIGDLDILVTGPPNRVATSDTTHNRVRVWDLRSGKALGELPVSAPGVLALSPDGAGIAVATGGGVQIWDLRPDRLVAAACALANRNLTAQEQAFYLGYGNAKTCPDLP